jgi:hypothetical protein
MSDVDIEIPRCTTIGFIENLKNDYFKEISQIDHQSAQQKFLRTYLSQNPYYHTRAESYQEKI